jgi:hypothetical protein
LPEIKFIEDSLIEPVIFANEKYYPDAGIGLIDSILTRAIIDNKYLIWTLDKKILQNLDNQFLYK